MPSRYAILIAFPVWETTGTAQVHDRHAVRFVIRCAPSSGIATGFEIADAQVGAVFFCHRLHLDLHPLPPLTLATDPVVVPVQVGCVAGITSTDGCFSCRPDCGRSSRS